MRTEDRPASGPAPTGTVRTVAVATDRSATAERAVRWAAEMAERYGAELYVIQVVVPQSEPTTQYGQAEATRASAMGEALASYARELAGDRGHARVVVDDDPARAIVETAEASGADLLVVGNAGMSGRKEFLLGNVPNRVSHIARCSVVIVNTVGDGDGARPATATRPRRGDPEEPEVEGHLLGRAAHISRVMAKHGFAELFAGSKRDPEETQRSRASSWVARPTSER